MTNEVGVLKLYVWNYVVTPNSNSIMFALAYSVEDARRAILDDCPGNCWYIERELQEEPRVFADTIGFSMCGWEG